MTGALCIVAGVSGDFSVTLINGDVESTGTPSQTATYRLSNDRSVYHVTNAGTVAQYAWLQSYADVSNYEARVTVLSGSVSGTTGSWLNLGTTRDWTVTDPTTGDGFNYASFTVEIRNASTTIVLDSATITLAAERI